MFYLRSSLQNWEDAYRLLIALGFPFLNAGTVHPIFNFMGGIYSWFRQHLLRTTTKGATQSGRTYNNIQHVCAQTFYQEKSFFQYCFNMSDYRISYNLLPAALTDLSGMSATIYYLYRLNWIKYWFSSSGLAESAHVRSCLIPVTINNTQSCLTRVSAYFVYVWPSHSVVQNLKKRDGKSYGTPCVFRK